MTHISVRLTLIAAFLAVATPMKAQTVDVRAAQDALIRWTMEDIARQRAQIRENAASAAAQKQLPDFSHSSTPVEGLSSSSRNSSSELHCHTMSMGDGNSVTDCF